MQQTKIYLISPEKIDLGSFSKNLIIALKTGYISLFQLRLKNIDIFKKITYIKEIKKICTDHNCPFILNDDYISAIEYELDGVHIGNKDGSIIDIKNKSKHLSNFLIGVSCYDKKELAISSIKDGANYISFGAFFDSKTKKSPGKPDINLVKWYKNNYPTIPLVAIGGINDINCKELIYNKVDFMAVISYIWENEFGTKEAILSMQSTIEKFSSNE